MHSGMAGGITPNPYYILNRLLSRIIDFETQVVINDFEVKIPEHRLKETEVNTFTQRFIYNIYFRTYQQSFLY
jgi:hypothetical protein